MRLFISTGSPFAGKCRIVAREKGLIGRVEEVLMVFPYKDGDEFLAASPMGQVPALIADDGQPMTDSPLICAYFDTLGDGPRLLPAEGPDHWRVRRLETLADSIQEMAVKVAMESRRPDGEKSSTWIAYWNEGLNRALDQAEARAPKPDTIDLGSIGLAVAGHYVDFRRPELGWRTTRPRLADLADALDRRPSFAETRPS